MVCKYACRRISPETTRQLIRKSLGELSNNIMVDKKRRNRIPKTRYGCKLCNLYLYQHKDCWREHIRDRQCKIDDFWWWLSAKPARGAPVTRYGIAQLLLTVVCKTLGAGTNECQLRTKFCWGASAWTFSKQAVVHMAL